MNGIEEPNIVEGLRTNTHSARWTNPVRLIYSLESPNARGGRQALGRTSPFVASACLLLQ